MRDLSLELLGTRMPAPVLLAPISVQTLLHEEGDSLGQGRGFGQPAAGHARASATALEEIAEANGQPALVPALLAE